jgi:uncharacterized membrane protein YuzA (DUF378 family)
MITVVSCIGYLVGHAGELERINYVYVGMAATLLLVSCCWDGTTIGDW